LDFSLVSNKILSEILLYYLAIWAQCQMKWDEVTWNYSTYDLKQIHC